MTQNLVALVRQAASLLETCRWREQAKWFEDRSKVLSDPQLSKKDLLAQFKEIEDILGGAGSFSDISLEPPRKSGMTSDQATELQFDLINKIGEAIDAERKKLKKTT